MKDQKQLLEEFEKGQVAQHAIWLDEPTTQLFVKMLRSHSSNLVRTLQDGVLFVSDKEKEDYLRASIKTTNAIIAMVTTPEVFVKQSTKQ